MQEQERWGQPCLHRSPESSNSSMTSTCPKQACTVAAIHSHANSALNLASSQQGLLVMYFIPGCAGRGVWLGSERSLSAGGGGVWKSGNPPKPPKRIKASRMKNHPAQNVGRVLISRTQHFLKMPADRFARGTKHVFVCRFPPMFPLWPNRQPLLLSTSGGQIGTSAQDIVFSLSQNVSKT